MLSLFFPAASMRDMKKRLWSQNTEAQLVTWRPAQANTGRGSSAQYTLASVVHPIHTYTRARGRGDPFGCIEELRKLCNEERLEEAFQLVDLMDQQGVLISRDAIYCLLQCCIRKKDLAASRRVRCLMVSQGFDSIAVLGDHLIRLFTSCGSLLEAKEAFHRVAKPSVYTWNAIAAAHVQLGEEQMVIDIYHKMQQDDIKPDKVTFLYTLKACGSTGKVGPGRLAHDQILRNDLALDVVVGSTLIDMYAKCGSLEEARTVFDGLPNRNLVSWGAMISGYVQQGHGFSALELFEKMQQEGLNPSNVVFSCILKACGSISALNWGRMIHAQTIRSSLESDLVIGSTIVDMYVRCNRLEEAQKVFDKLPKRDLVLWSTMIAGYAQNEVGFLALQLFEKLQLEEIKPDEVVFSCTVKACGYTGIIGLGRCIHEQIVRRGLESLVVVGNALVDMYAKCGNLKEAQIIFDKLPNRNVVTWGTMAAEYVRHGCGRSALNLFEKMQQEGIEPDEVLFLCLLKACADVGAIGQGKLIHEEITRSGLRMDLLFGHTLIDMYAKCGSLAEAHSVFKSLPQRDVVAWGVMIEGYALFGFCRLAMQCVDDMRQEGLKPDDMIFTSILGFCSRAGLLKEGCCYFKSMIEKLGIRPSIEHYSCMIDLLGRAGYLKEAEDLLLSIPISPDIICWRSLLAGCRTHNNVELGMRCFDQIVKLNPNDAGGYVVMSNIYADAHMWNGVARIYEIRGGALAPKKPGCALVEVHNVVHEFMAGGQNHPQTDLIHSKLKRLSDLVKEEGYVPELQLVLQPAFEEEEDALWINSEKLIITV